MPLVLVRVDCRLIHGQVLEAWVPFCHADCLVVANDEAAEDLLQQSIMTMAVPPTVEVFVLKVKEAMEAIMAGRWTDKRTILLLADLEDAVTCYRYGLEYENLNLGNLFCTPGKKRVTCSVCLDQVDMAYLQEIQEMGVFIDARPVPKEKSRSFSDLLDCCQHP